MNPDARVWARLTETVPAWQWAVISRLLPRTERKMLARAEKALVDYAVLRDIELVTAPVGYALCDGRRSVTLAAEAWGRKPAEQTDMVDPHVPDVVGAERCPRCRSSRVQLVWLAMASWDCDGWNCLACDHSWTGRVGLR